MEKIQYDFVDSEIKYARLQEEIRKAGADACIVSSNVNLYYLCGRVFGGYLYIPAEGNPLYFVRRPAGIDDKRAIYIRKPEDIPALLAERKISLPSRLLLEGDQLTYNEYARLQAVFPMAETANVSQILRRVRSIKTPWEIEQFRYSAAKHAEGYNQIASCYSPGITDLEFQARVENVMRSLGSIGYFRSFGSNMEIHMGSVLAAENAESPSPFDFALGGAGAHPSLPIGANGTVLKEGTAVMFDMAGNFTAYITDMSRVFSVGKLPEKAYKMHQTALDIQSAVIEKTRPGTSCADLYNLSLQMADDAGFGKYFMGTRQQAKFVGHGVGIEINELPVLTGRSKEVMEPGIVFALEPKFVIPGIGAVGIENTFLVTEDGVEKLTCFEEGIVEL